MKSRLNTDEFIIKEMTGDENLPDLWNQVDLLTLPQTRKAKYITGFATSTRCLEAVLHLRYQIFNVELGEGLASSEKTGLDRDQFDEQMTHLVLVDEISRDVVGTYRMQTIDQALAARGIYSAQEYDLAQLKPYFPQLVELGRACLSVDHRNMSALIQLWLGIGAYMNKHGSRYLFGCTSLTSTDPDDGWRAMKTLRKRGAFHPELMLPATPKYSCGEPSREFAEEIGEAIPLPKLFNAYMRLGCQVISQPAIDREFGTVDFLILLDGNKVKMSLLDILENTIA
jgi:putative hemolysin